MHDLIQSYKEIISAIEHRLKDQNITKIPKVIAVSKTFNLDKILPLINHGHLDYGENKVQEALEKWSEIKLTKKDLSYILSVNYKLIKSNKLLRYLIISIRLIMKNLQEK